MSIRLVSAILIAYCLLPGVGHAALIINEIAWMGSDESANYEWIELHNTGSAPVDITSWRLTDGANLTINLAGIVPAGGYALLERNRSSEAYLGNPPFLVYTGALVNTGATLTLERGDGSIADQVAGGENWQNIGGDNTTKDTAQYTTGGWITAVSTPGAANHQTPSPPPVTESVTVSPTTAGSRTILTGNAETVGGDRKITVRQSESVLTLNVTAPAVGYVGQPLRLSATASGLSQVFLNSLRYQWNFGDAEDVQGYDTVSHTYRYPGTYVVTVEASYGRYSQLARQEITILPVSVSLTLTNKGDVQLHNDALYEVDVSGYRLVGERTLALPARTILVPKGTITIPYRRLGSQALQVAALYDRERVLVATTRPSQGAPPAPLVVAASVPSPVVQGAASSLAPPRARVVPPSEASPTFSFAETEPTDTETEITPSYGIEVAAAATEGDLVSPAPPAAPPAWWTYWVLGLVLSGTILLVLWQRRVLQVRDAVLDR